MGLRLACVLFVARRVKCLHLTRLVLLSCLLYFAIRTSCTEAKKTPSFKFRKFGQPQVVAKHLFGDVTLETFFSKYHEKNYLHVTGKGTKHMRRHDRLFHPQDVTYLFEQNVGSARTEEISKDGSAQSAFHLEELSVEEDGDLSFLKFEDGRRRGANLTNEVLRQRKAGVMELMNLGFTLFWERLCFVWPPAIHFADGLAKLFGEPVGANMFFTPSYSVGLPIHFDYMDVIIVQISGVKKWRLHPPIRPLSRLEDKLLLDDENPKQVIPEKIITVYLEQGDVLYLPRGWLHSPSTEDSHSLHITFGLDGAYSNTFQSVIDRVMHAGAQSLPKRFQGPFDVKISSKNFTSNWGEFLRVAAWNTGSPVSSTLGHLKHRSFNQKPRHRLPMSTASNLTLNAITNGTHDSRDLLASNDFIEGTCVSLLTEMFSVLEYPTTKQLKRLSDEYTPSGPVFLPTVPTYLNTKDFPPMDPFAYKNGRRSSEKALAYSCRPTPTSEADVPCKELVDEVARLILADAKVLCRKAIGEVLEVNSKQLKGQEKQLKEFSTQIESSKLFREYWSSRANDIKEQGQTH